jgi:hypothetical protein
MLCQMQIIQCSIDEWIWTMDYKLLFSGDIWENNKKTANCFPDQDSNLPNLK